MNTYLETSKEFQPLVVKRTANGVVSTVTAGVQYTVVPRGTHLSDGVWATPATLEGQIGFYTNTFSPGIYEVGARIVDLPEEPIISCGLFRIK